MKEQLESMWETIFVEFMEKLKPVCTSVNMDLYIVTFKASKLMYPNRVELFYKELQPHKSLINERDASVIPMLKSVSFLIEHYDSSSNETKESIMEYVFLLFNLSEKIVELR